MIYAIGAFTAFFLALLVFTKNGRNAGDGVLGLWCAVIGFHFSLAYLYFHGDIFSYPNLLGAAVPFPFLHGPFLYLYTQRLTLPNAAQDRKWPLHFLLPIIIVLILSPFYQLGSEMKLEVWRNAGQGFERHLLLCRALLTLSGIYYVVFTYRLLRQHRARILREFSNREKINLDWLQFLFYGMAVLWFVIIFIRGDENIFKTATLFIFLIGYYGIKQVGVFSNAPQSTPEVEGEPVTEIVLEEKKKYAKSGLNESAAQMLHRQLLKLIEDERPYLDPDLTLSQLASRLDMHPNYLSQVINDKEGVTFYDFINALRVKEFERRVQLPEGQQLTLVALAYDCGFNSKTSFNRNFKKVTGLSPSDYLRRLGVNLV